MLLSTSLAGLFSQNNKRYIAQKRGGGYRDWLSQVRVLSTQHKQLVSQSNSLFLVDVQATLQRQALFDGSLKIVVFKITSSPDKISDTMSLQSYIHNTQKHIKAFLTALEPMLKKELTEEKVIKMSEEEKKKKKEDELIPVSRDVRDIYERGDNEQFLDSMQQMQKGMAYSEPKTQSRSSMKNIYPNNSRGSRNSKESKSSLTFWTIMRIKLQMKRLLWRARKNLLLRSRSGMFKK